MLPSAVARRIACSCGTRLLSSAGPHRVPSRSLPAELPSLRDFMQPSAPSEIGDANPAPYIDPQLLMGGGRRVYLETYGCQMNVADTEVIRSLLNTAGFERAASIDEAEVVLLNTCAIREGAEQKIWQRLRQIRSSRLGSTAARHSGTRGHALVAQAAKPARKGLEDARGVQVGVRIRVGVGVGVRVRARARVTAQPRHPYPYPYAPCRWSACSAAWPSDSRLA